MNTFLLNDMKAYLLMVEPWRGRIADSLGAARLIGERFIGGVINKVPVNTAGHVKDREALPGKERRQNPGSLL
jgi:hypothetical protein